MLQSNERKLQELHRRRKQPTEIPQFKDKTFNSERWRHDCGGGLWRIQQKAKELEDRS